MDPPLFMWRLTILLTARVYPRTCVWVELVWIEDTYMCLSFCLCRSEERRIPMFLIFSNRHNAYTARMLLTHFDFYKLIINLYFSFF